MSGEPWLRHQHYLPKVEPNKPENHGAKHWTGVPAPTVRSVFSSKPILPVFMSHNGIELPLGPPR